MGSLTSQAFFVDGCTIKPDKDLTIVGASEDYLLTAHTTEENFGCSLLEVFPDNPQLDDANGVKAVDGYVTLPELPGIGFEGKVDLYAVMKELAG